VPRTLKIVLAYDGSQFHGWQVQPGLPTVQSELREAIHRVTGEELLPQGSGRTDAGVHALAQVASCRMASPIPAENLSKALNHVLPPAIRVLEVREAAADFHARHSAKAKTYEYRVYREAICPPFLARYVFHYPYPLDEDAMRRAAALIVGRHDFTSFAAVAPEAVAQPSDSQQHGFEVPGTPDPTPQRAQKRCASMEEGQASNLRTIYSSCWQRRGEQLVYTVRGDGFLHHMVRNLVGTFLLVGKGSLNQDGLRRILELRDRSAAGPTAPASGLFLVTVEY